VSGGRLPEIKNCRRKKVVWSLTRGSSYSDLTDKNRVFGNVVADGTLSLTRGGRTGIFNCMHF